MFIVQVLLLAALLACPWANAKAQTLVETPDSEAFLHVPTPADFHWISAGRNWQTIADRAAGQGFSVAGTYCQAEDQASIQADSKPRATHVLLVLKPARLSEAALSPKEIETMKAKFKKDPVKAMGAFPVPQVTRSKQFFISGGVFDETADSISATFAGRSYEYVSDRGQPKELVREVAVCWMFLRGTHFRLVAAGPPGSLEWAKSTVLSWRDQTRVAKAPASPAAKPKLDGKSFQLFASIGSSVFIGLIFLGIVIAFLMWRA